MRTETTPSFSIESVDGALIAFFFLREQRKLLEKCAMTALSSKLISQQKDFFAKMVVDAVMMLDDLLQLKMIGIKKVQGGALEVSFLSQYLLGSLLEQKNPLLSGNQTMTMFQTLPLTHSRCILYPLLIYVYCKQKLNWLISRD